MAGANEPLAGALQLCFFLLYISIFLFLCFPFPVVSFFFLCLSFSSATGVTHGPSGSGAPFRSSPWSLVRLVSYGAKLREGPTLRQSLSSSIFNPKPLAVPSDRGISRHHLPACLGPPPQPARGREGCVVCERWASSDDSTLTNPWRPAALSLSRHFYLPPIYVPSQHHIHLYPSRLALHFVHFPLPLHVPFPLFKLFDHGPF